MAERIPPPLAWKIAAFIDTSRVVDGSFPYRHGPLGFVDGHYGWTGVMGADGKQLTFETPEEAQAWIAAQPAPTATEA